MSAVDVSHTISGEGPPLYMVHGIGSRRVTWDGLLPGLEEHFTCVRYDLRGHGESPVPPVPYSLDDLVDDLEVLLAELSRRIPRRPRATVPRCSTGLRWWYKRPPASC